MKLAQRMDRLAVESAFEVLVRARALEAQGRSVIHLEIGEPDFPTPAHIVEAGKRALDEGWTHYGPPPGLPELREAVAADVAQRRGIRVGPEHVSIVPGGKPMIFFPMLALLEPGDEVIYPNPGFPIYESMIRTLGATPVPVPLMESRGFSFDLNWLRDKLTSRTKMLVLNSPHNPTGGVIPAEDMCAIAEMVRERDLIVLSDEIYSRLYYGEPPVSIAQYPGMLEKTIILDGFSKTYAMTGWRLGYGVMPTWLVDAVTKLMVNSVSCVAGFIQRAGITALCGPQEPLEAMLTEFHRRRDAFCAGLNRIPGFRCALPGGAFYAYPNVEGAGIPSRKLADLLLQEAGVASLDGGSFGEYGDGYIRFSYANSFENLMEAVTRIEAVLRTRTSTRRSRRGSVPVPRPHCDKRLRCYPGPDMTVLVSLLRGVNLAGNRKVKMDDLRALYESLGFTDVQTYINSGNVLFRTAARDLTRVQKRIEDAIQGACGFHTDVMLRSPSDLRGVLERNPFQTRPSIEPSKLAIHFLAGHPDADCCKQASAMAAAPEELHIHGRELYIYYANGMARPKLSLAQVEKTLHTLGTSRNWNTVRKLSEMAAKLEAL